MKRRRDVNLHDKNFSDSEMLRLLLDESPDLIYFKDLNSKFIRGSKALCGHLGIAPEELPGKSDYDFFEAERVHPHFREEQEIISTGKPLISRVEENIGKNGKSWWVLTSKAAFRDRSGKIIGTFGISKNITSLKQAEQELEKVNKDLVTASHRAGMAEVAIGVLHNVGNALNNVNVSVELIKGQIRHMKMDSLAKLADLIREKEQDLSNFLSRDERGKKIVPYLENFHSYLQQARTDVLQEITNLARSVEHVKEIVAAQQEYAQVCGVIEEVNPVDLVEDALKIHGVALDRHRIFVFRQFEKLPRISVDRHKALQILVNLLQNAKYACTVLDRPNKQVSIRIKSAAENKIVIEVSDNGVGISPKNLTRIFSQCFTTRREGHGFGLHSSQLAARELGGSLTAYSEGVGKGATFTLLLPINPPGK